MRLLILTQYFHPEVGATQTRMREFARHLAKAGHDVTVVTEFPNHPQGRIPESYRGKWVETERLDGFQVLRVRVWTSPSKTFWTRLLFYGSYLVMAVLRSLWVARPDCVLATSPPLLVALGGYFVALVRRSRFVFDVRDLWPEAAVALGELRNPRLVAATSRMARFLYRRADRVTAVTRGFCRHIQAQGVAPERITWLPNGTLSELFKPGPASTEFRRECGMESRFLVTFAGTLGIAQGLATVLRSAELGLDDDTIGFVIIGDGPFRDRLLEEKERRGLTNLHVKGQVPLEEIVPFLNASDALLVSLRKDPVFDTFVPSKLFDCMACSKPVLLGVNGEAAEILRAAGAGIQFEPGDPSSLLAATRKLRDNPALCAEMGRRGREYVLKYYDRARQAGQLEKLLVALTAGRDGRKKGRQPDRGGE